MFCLSPNFWRRARSRRQVKPAKLARVAIEELEPRTLLATSPLGAALSAPLSGPAPTFSPVLATSNTPGAGVPTGSQTTPAGTGSSLGLNSGNNAAGPAGQNLATLPGTFAQNPGGGPALNGPGFNGPGGTFGTLARFPALPTGALLQLPGANTFGVLGPAWSPVVTSVRTFLGISAPGAVPYGRADFAMMPFGPGSTLTNFYTGAPQYFDMATHRLLFVVGGPNPPAGEDYLQILHDDILPEANSLRLVYAEDTVSGTPGEQAEEIKAELSAGLEEAGWPNLSATYFRHAATPEHPVPTKAIGLTSAGLATAQGPAVVQAKEKKAPVGPVAAVMALALLGGPSWRKEERRRKVALWDVERGCSWS